MHKVKAGQVWERRKGKWISGGGQPVIVERIELCGEERVHCRYCDDLVHTTASWNMASFLNRMALIKDV